MSVVRETVCPVCDETLELSVDQVEPNRFSYDCPSCGKFGLTETARAAIGQRSEDDRMALSYAIRRLTRRNDTPVLDTHQIDQLAQSSLPSLEEQVANLIAHIGESTVPGGSVMNHPARLRPIIGAESKMGAKFVIEHLLEQGLCQKPRNDLLGLAFPGWQRYEEQRRGQTESRLAFMAMEFGDTRLDRVFNECFKPAVAQTGFTLRRLDEAPTAGLIDDAMRVAIRTSKFVVADLSTSNEGAYWEAGFAEGLGRPVFYTCEKRQYDEDGTHFDTSHLHTVLWSHDNLNEAAERLKVSIRATLPSEAILTNG